MGEYGISTVPHFPLGTSGYCVILYIQEGTRYEDKRVEGLLKPTSSVSTVVSSQLCTCIRVYLMYTMAERVCGESQRDFPLARMLGLDFMHEFELGVWKLVLAHLIRLLVRPQVCDPNKGVSSPLSDSTIIVPRLRLILTFGASTIRNFANNTSEMKKLAAHDFEDILHVCAFNQESQIELLIMMHPLAMHPHI